MKFLSLEQVDLKNRRVLVRVDYNVPLNPEGQVADEGRILASLQTLKFLIKKGAKIILMSHLGRPDGKKDLRFSLKPVAFSLAKHLNQPVAFCSDCMDPNAEAAIHGMEGGAVLLLENLRFYKEEEANDGTFAASLAKLGDVYVNDAFGACHRAHASVDALPKIFNERYLGFLMMREWEFLNPITKHPEKPLGVILGGAKVSDKIKVIERLLEVADCICIGGAMAYTFLSAQNINVGKSFTEPSFIETARRFMDTAKEKGVQFCLPVDHVFTDHLDLKSGTFGKISTHDTIPDGSYGIDIGPQTALSFQKALGSMKTIFWNGPMGIFEHAPAQKGTEAMIQFLGKSSAKTILGGGDTAHALQLLGKGAQMTFVSTGGGASLELLEGKPLPGFEALRID